MTMKALMWKEMRELFPAWALLLGSAVVAGLIDLLYNWRKDYAAGASLWLCVGLSLFAALAAGANAVARETSSTLAFLGAQPVSRGQVWRAKLLVTFAALLSLVALSFLACLGLLALRDYHPLRGALFGSLDFDTNAVAVFVFGIPMLFLFGLAVSSLARSVMGAALAALLSGTALALAYLWLSLMYLPSRWGPWLGFDGSAFPVWAHCLAVTVLALLLLMASAWAFARTPVLESRRRLGRGLKFFVILAPALTFGLLLVLLLRPTPLPREVAEISLDPTGHWIALGRSYGMFNLWMLGVDGTGLQRVARGPVYDTQWLEGERGLVFDWSGTTTRPWLASPTAGRWRLSRPLRTTYFISPRGTYAIEEDGKSTTVLRNGSDALRLGEAGATSVLAWSPDERFLYTTSSVRHQGQRASIYAVRLPDGARRALADFDDDTWIFPANFLGDPTKDVSSVSPDGRWLLLVVRKDWPRGGYTKLKLIDLSTNAQHDLSGWRPYGWTPDGGYLWLVSADAQRPGLRVLNLATLTNAALLTPASFGGLRPLEALVSPRGDVVAIYAARYERPSPHTYGLRERALFLAQPDGSRIRRLGEFTLPLPHLFTLCGWTWDGNLIVASSDRDAPDYDTLSRLNPKTLTRTVIYPTPRRVPQAEGPL